MATMAYGLGVGAVPYTMLGELFTPKVIQPKTVKTNPKAFNCKKIQPKNCKQKIPPPNSP